MTRSELRAVVENANTGLWFTIPIPGVWIITFRHSNGWVQVNCQEFMFYDFGHLARILEAEGVVFEGE